MPDPFIETRDIVKRYTRGDEMVTALRGITFDVYRGTATAITGASGSGKSTLLQILGGLDRADEGRVVVGGVNLGEASRSELNRYRRSLGFVFQRFHLLPELTAIENVMAPVIPFRTIYDKRERAVELLGRVGLQDCGRALPGDLSGGQQQRVALARALMNHPRVVLADEPTGNLDEVAAQMVVELLLSLKLEGVTVVVATHDHLVASRCDRRLTLRDGWLDA